MAAKGENDRRNILVLCIDRDDDVGRKSGIKTSIVGRNAMLEAAKNLALADPSESDLNAMFEAVRIYDEIKKEDSGVEVAMVSGHVMRGYRADKIIGEQLDRLIEDYNVRGVVVVTDGADDEQMLSLVESRTKVLSVRTVIVKQTKELEKSYYVIKEILRDPYFSRIIFGLPGIVALIYLIVTSLNMSDFALNAAIGLIGVYLIIKGFGIEDRILSGVADFSRTFAIERASFPIYLACALVLFLSLWSGYENVGTLTLNMAFTSVSEETFMKGMAFAGGSIGLLSLALLLFLTGRMGDMYYRTEYHKIKKYALSIVSVIVAFMILDQSIKFTLFWFKVVPNGPKPIDLILTLLLGFAIFIMGFAIVSVLYTRNYIARRLQLNQEVKDNEGNSLGVVNYIDRKTKFFTYAKNNGGGDAGGVGKEKTKIPFRRVVLIKDRIVVVKPS